MSRVLLLCIASLVVTACGGGDGATAPKPVAVASVSVSLSSASLLPGRTAAASAELRGAAGEVLTGRSLTWSSSNTAVATVDGSGNISAVAAGTSIISAASEGKSGSANLTVIPPVASVVISGSTRVKVGDSYTYTVTAKLADGTVVTRPVTWSISDPTRATISQSGVLAPIAPGAFRIQATIDGSLWDAGYTAYDWLSLSGSGNTFLSLEADNTITNKFGSSEYAQLVFACSATGNFFVWVQTSRFVTQSGLVTYTFDAGAPTQTFWTESSDFSTLFKPGSNLVSKAFAAQMAAARVFIFVFSEFNASAKGSTFRVTGLSDKINTLYALCPSNALVAPASLSPIATAFVRASSPADVNVFARLSAEREQRAAAQGAADPSQAAAQLARSSAERAIGGLVAGSTQQAVRRRR